MVALDLRNIVRESMSLLEGGRVILQPREIQLFVVPYQPQKPDAGVYLRCKGPGVPAHKGVTGPGGDSKNQLINY